MSDSLWPHEPQHARPPSPSPTPGVHPNSPPSSWWGHPTISSSVVPFCLAPIPHGISLFQWVSSLHQVAKVLEFHLQHQSFQWIFRMISFRTDWLDLLAVQETLKSILQHHCSKASIFWCSVFFISNTINNLHEIIAHNHHNHITCVLSSISSILQRKKLRLRLSVCPRSQD